MRLSFLMVLATVAAVGCGAPSDRVFFLRTGSADLPIQVSGPEDASTLVVFVHGGPGGSGLVYSAAMPDAFDPISAQHLLAFYDQRGAGAAQGETQASELTVERHVKDLEDVLALLRVQYPRVERVVLLGHSWGGALTAEYLVDTKRAAGIAGWINVDGSTDFPRLLTLTREWGIEKAKAKVAAGGDSAKQWQDALAWYEKTPTLDKSTLLQHYRNVDLLGGTVFDPASAKGDRLGPLFFSPYAAGADTHNVGLSQNAMADELLSYDVHPRLGNVTLPTLFLFGAQDGRVPIQLGEEAFAALGTPDGAKSFVPFERSAHRPFSEEPEKFAQSVLEFIAR